MLSFITPQIAVGDYRDACYPKKLKEEQGITHILCVAKECALPVLANYFAYAHYPLLDLGGNPPELYHGAVDWALNALRRDGTKILIHCCLGSSRSVTIAAAVLAKQGMTFEDAMTLLYQKRSLFKPHPDLVDDVRNTLKV